MSRELDDHREFLADRLRVAAFESAIASAVRAGDIVVDLGCGTGIFGLLACRSGAARVYAIEETGMAEIARSLAAANGYADRVTVIRGHSRDVMLPERADVIVSDQIGHFGWEAGVLAYFEDARRRFLKPAGRLIPRRVHLWVAPVEVPAAWRQNTFWGSRPFDFDMAPAQGIALNSGHPMALDGAALLAAGRQVATLDPGGDNSFFSFAAELPIERHGVLHGIAGWFSADLADHVSITNAPGVTSRINRRQVVFFVAEPRDVRAEQIVAVEMAIRPADLLVKWIVEHWPDAAALRARAVDRRLARFEHSTLAGMPISRDEVRRAAPSFVPRLTDRGEARRLVIDSIDGRATVADIERRVGAAHGGLFTGPADVARFVAEVVSRYSE